MRSVDDDGFDEAEYEAWLEMSESMFRRYSPTCLCIPEQQCDECRANAVKMNFTTYAARKMEHTCETCKHEERLVSELVYHPSSMIPSIPDGHPCIGCNPMGYIIDPEGPTPGDFPGWEEKC